jgi:hypothetical protein
MSDFMDWLVGSPDKLKKIDTGTKEQQQFGGKDLINWLQQEMQQGGGFDLANQHDKNLLNGPDAFNNFAAPYLQQFQEQILPQIAERFAGGGALSSSGFGQALSSGASSLQANLAQLFSELQGQAAGRQQGQFQNLSNTGLNYQPFAYEKQQGSAGVLGPLATGLTTALAGPLAGMAAGGITSLFKNNNTQSNSGMYDTLFRTGAFT